MAKLTPERFVIPDLQSLTRGLATALGATNQQNASSLSIIGRERVATASTFPCERITMRQRDGEVSTVFCKYEAGIEHNMFGHRGGVGYEAAVYQHLLHSAGLSVPEYLGSHLDDDGHIWLFLEDLGPDDSRIPPKPKMELASAWLGEFHRNSVSVLDLPSASFLRRHGPDYYSGWPERTDVLAGDLHDTYPWLKSLIGRFGVVVDTLQNAQQVLTHGEFYPSNVLVRQDRIRVVDWESAAIAAGEIDLAAAIEGNRPEIMASYIGLYVHARWPDGPPSSFERTLQCARLLLQFRWLGARSEWTRSERARHRFLMLRELGETLKLI